MIGPWHLRIIGAVFLAALAAGCGAPPTFTVETVVHPDGSCERTICQPRYECLPAEAVRPEWAGRMAPDPGIPPPNPPQEPLKPEWVARWKEVIYRKGPPASPRLGREAGNEHYFVARGSFRNPGEIPPHYRRVEDKFPQAGASELKRTYERLDRAFVVEHRWSERITDVVTLAGFLDARDKLLDMLLPLYLRLFGEAIGPEYDISALSTFVRGDVRQALKEAAEVLYDAGIRRRVRRHDGEMDPELIGRLAALSRRIGFDPLDAKGKPVANREFEQRCEDYVRRMLLRHVRHRDGSVLDRSEADRLIARARADSDFMKLDQRQNERLDRFVGPLLPRVSGLYGFPLAIGDPQFAFTLRLPGELVETNGVGHRDGRTRWSFTGGDIFPDGYEMRARSVEIDRDAQRKALGRVAIDDEETALEFLDLVARDPALLEAVRQLKDNGDPTVLMDDAKRTTEQIIRARRLREMLLGR